jgi:PKD domain
VQVHQPTPDPPPLPPPVLNLTASSSRPAVGKRVVVTAALNPSHAGTSYQLNWGDGSAVETVSDSATHRYAKAKTYTVLARTTTVDKLQLNHEIVLHVQPVIWPRVTVLLASMAGLGLLSLPMLVNVTTGCRWDTPKMTFVDKQPYVSLSFVPDVGPAEERITFLKTKRRSG